MAQGGPRHEDTGAVDRETADPGTARAGHHETAIAGHHGIEIVEIKTAIEIGDQKEGRTAAVDDLMINGGRLGQEEWKSQRQPSRVLGRHLGV